MRVIKLDDKARDEFVNERRLGVLCSLRQSGAPFALPLWYRWDGKEIEMFSERAGAKVKRLIANPLASLLVANNPNESARWVSFEGIAKMDDSGLAAAGRLLERYVAPVDSPAYKGTMKMFAKADLVRIAIAPTTIVTYAELHQ